MDKYTKLKRLAWEYNMELPRRGLVLYTFGNLSAIDRDLGVFAIKPSGVRYEILRPEDMVVLDLANNVLSGKLRPSSDTKTHTVLYNNFPEIGGIVHTHSTFAVAWAQAQKSIPIFGTTHADHLTSDIPCTNALSDDKIRGDYEEETGNLIVNTFYKLPYTEIEMVLVANHGPFTWGRTPEKAVYNSVVLEEIARMAYLTLQINPATARVKDSLIEKHYQRKHGKDAYYGQNA
jgi:L-ribulose-5-phosphate 4-epimerase